MGKRLYVGNLPYDADEESIRAAFSAGGGTVARVHIPLDRETQRPRGFAFVEMASDAEAQQALLAMNGAMFGSRTLRVSEAEDRRPGGPGGGSGGGPGGGFGGGGRGPDGGSRGPGGPRGPGNPGGPRPERARGTADAVAPAPRAERGPERREPTDDDRTQRFGPDARPRRERERERERERDARRAPGRRRQEDDGEEFHGRRGGRRFDDDDEE